MRSILFWGMAILTVFTSCSTTESNSANELFPFDSVWHAQVHALAEAKAELTKEIRMNGVAEQTRFTPNDTLAWANELEIFQQIATINKAGNKDAYSEVVIKDSASNLMIRRLYTNEALPLKEVRIYYLNDPANLRRIEAWRSDQNSLYKSARVLSLIFSEVNNKTLLTSYSIVGGQHMMLGDTVQFDIQSSIFIQ